MNIKRLLKVMVLGVLLAGIFASVGSAANLEEKRQHIRNISNTTLLKLYSLQPAARGYVENAAGYAVFGNWGVKLVFIGGGTGKGMAVNNSNNHEVFMDMITGTAGFGLGAKTYNVVFIFENEKALNDFFAAWEPRMQTELAALEEAVGRVAAEDLWRKKNWK